MVKNKEFSGKEFYGAGSFIKSGSKAIFSFSWLPLGQRGYTLLEILLVLAIISVLMAVSIPRFGYMMERQELATEARQLANHFRLAQQKAVTTGQNCRLHFYLYGDRYRTDFPSGRENFYLPQGIDYAWVNFPQYDGRFGVRELYFLPSGAPNRGGTVGLRNREGDRIYIIVTPATGRVRISHEPPG